MGVRANLLETLASRVNERWPADYLVISNPTGNSWIESFYKRQGKEKIKMTGDNQTLADRMAQLVNSGSFREHTTGAVFQLSLTQGQAVSMLALDAGKRLIPHGAFMALQAKGLVERDMQRKSICLTEPGRHVAELLKLAGFTYPPTDTPEAA
jgi:hypothetical protein